MWSQPWTLASRSDPGRRNQPVIKAEQEQQDAADQVEMRVRRRAA